MGEHGRLDIMLNRNKRAFKMMGRSIVLTIF